MNNETGTPSRKRLVVLLMGPTASGKTDIAVELVGRLDCDIVSVDSAMVYRGMDIGTAKPDAETLAKAPHRLIDIRDPAEPYSAGDFIRDARDAINTIHTAGSTPLLVGGTMLYFRAFRRGIAELPGADPEIRESLDRRAKDKGWAELHAELSRVDPAAAARIHPNDPQRIQRALEVYQMTGTPISRLQADVKPLASAYRILPLVVAPSTREVLKSNIKIRFNSMIEKGFLNEVSRLFAREDLHEDLPSMRAVGYRQLWRHLAGKTDLELAIEQAVTATRQLAKRQMTWLRAESNAHWFDALEPGLTGPISDLVAHAMDN